MKTVKTIIVKFQHVCINCVMCACCRCFTPKLGVEVKKEVAMSLANLSFPIHELTWEHYWVVMEELGLSETETTEVLTKVLGPVACLKFTIARVLSGLDVNATDSQVYIRTV